MKQPVTSHAPIIVCAAIILHCDRVLLTLRPADKQLGGYWEFPGGKLEPGESPHQALHRELREELDISIAIDDLLETVEHAYAWGRVRILGYLCRLAGGTIRHLEVADHSWVAIGDLNDVNILPADQPFIERLQALDLSSGNSADMRGSHGRQADHSL